jgi:hypothetical protein
MILGLSGRRIDAADAEQVRFPLQNVESVRLAVRRLLVGQKVTWLVSSAACGADLIALSEAETLGIERTVVLPFSREKFRDSSVVDRPGEWGELYDRVMDEVEGKGEVLIVRAKDHEDPFELVCQAILENAVALGKERHEATGAVMVWDGEARETPDYTAEFGADARKRGLAVFDLRTL